MKHHYFIQFVQHLNCPESSAQQCMKLYYLPIEDRYQSICFSKLETDRPAEVITCCDEQENPMICVLPDAETHKIQLSFSCEVTIKRKRQPELAQTELLYSKRVSEKGYTFLKSS